MNRIDEYARRFWDERKKEIDTKAFDELLSSCDEKEETYLRFVLATLPLSDLKLVPPETFLSAVRAAVKAREKFGFCKNIPEEDFLLYVLYPRVSDEELSDCRQLFQDGLSDMVSGLTAEEAIKAVNLWCGKNVTYRSTDDYTDSALNVCRRGFGRCGEESVFAVNALRSVGLPARQIYVPWWSHCDDNHAWAEAFDGEKWRYLGACEPEPVLDRGWFTTASSRAMLAHTRLFLRGEKDDFGFLIHGADVGYENGVVSLPVTEKYGETRKLTVTVLSGGAPEKNAEVRFFLLNMARWCEIAARKTDENGNANINLGLGSVKIIASHNGCRGEKIINIAEGNNVNIALQSDFSAEGAFEFHAPKGDAGFPAPLTKEQQMLRKKWLDEATEARKSKDENSQSPRTGSAIEMSGRDRVAQTEDGCVLSVAAPEDSDILWGQNTSLCLYKNGVFRGVELHDVKAGETGDFSLPDGDYRLITAYRLPDGDQLACEQEFTLTKGEEAYLTIAFRKADTESLFTDIPLPPFTLNDGKNEITGEELFAKAPVTLLVFAETGREPTEHIFNELIAASEGFEKTNCEIYFVLQNEKELSDRTLSAARKAIPKAKILYGEFNDMSPVARRLFLDPDKLPLLILANSESRAIYSNSGYNVGTAELILRLLSVL